MARRERLDHALNARLDEFEQKLFLLKIAYEKYFSGIEPIEPVKEREDLRRLVRTLQRERITNTRQRFRLQQLRARFASMELYWQRNLLMLERGTHPRARFRARLRGEVEPPPAEAPRRLTRAEKEDQALRAVYESYVAARRKCGQSDDLSYEAVKSVLKKQISTIRSRYRCKSVKLRVTVEDGKARVKAIPVR